MLIDPNAHDTGKIERFLSERLGGCWGFIERTKGGSVFESNAGDRVAVYAVERFTGMVRPGGDQGASESLVNVQYKILQRGELLKG